MAYEFRILGPVGMSRDGWSMAPGPPKRLAMMAALLLDGNRPVPLPSLAAAMWAGLPPRSAVANVRTHASALRRLLGDRLVARSRAYELRIEAAELDAAEFARLARAGREALVAGEPAIAIVRLGAALALWHGPAGDGLPRGTSLDTRLVALNEQRLDVFEDHVEARLHTRAFPEVTADLRRHLARWPMRERSWELLMLAQYRAGNASGALAAYAEARAALRGHLGIEPGPQLRELQRAVLNRDASLDGPPARTGAGPPGHARPRRAPPGGGDLGGGELAGRDYELAALQAALRGDRELVMLVGRAGIGKSALARRAAELVREDFPDGQVTIDLGGAAASPRPPEQVYAAVLRALDVPPDQPELLYGKRCLILLDDAAGAAQVRPVLAAGATLLVTSRRRLAGLDGAQCLEIGPLAGEDAVRLLAASAGAARVASDPAAVRELVRFCDGLPLALRILGERLARRPELPLRMLAGHVRSRPLDGLRLGDLSVREAYAADYRAIAAEDPVAARALPALGSLEPPATVTPEALASQLDEDPSRVFYALEQLVDAWLVESPRPGHYRAVGLAYAYAAELAAAGSTAGSGRASSGYGGPGRS